MPNSWKAIWDCFIFFLYRIAIRRVLQTLIGLDTPHQTGGTVYVTQITKPTGVDPIVEKFNTVMFTVGDFT